jgi:hypothetical protein
VYNTQLKETVLILIFAIVVVASGADLVADFSHGADTEHIVKEANDRLQYFQDIQILTLNVAVGSTPAD